jgi:uncharacterized protein (DUF1499 family)
MNPLPWLLGLVLTGCAGQGASGIPVPPPMDLTKIERPSSPNTALFGPIGRNRQPVDLITAPYSMTSEQLYDVVKTAIAKLPNTYILADYPDRLQLHYVVRSAVLNLPDLVSVQVEVGFIPEQSLLTMYSRSVYGYYDFKVNDQRLKAWLTAIYVGTLATKER